MSNIKWYREAIEAIEALHIQSPENRIINKLAAVHAHSDDPKAREYAKQVIEEIKTAQGNTKTQSCVEMKRGVPTARRLLAHCRARAYQEDDQ